MNYEFYIYTQHGENVWYWDLKDYKKVTKDIDNNKNDNSLSIEIQRWYGEDDFDFVEVYPNNFSHELPKYVQKFVNKIYPEGNPLD